LGERLLCKQEVIGSIPFTSTISWSGAGVERLPERHRGSRRDVIRLVRGFMTSLRGSISLDVEVGVGRHAVRVCLVVRPRG
jgi:hypothetical protein